MGRGYRRSHRSRPERISPAEELIEGVFELVFATIKGIVWLIKKAFEHRPPPPRTTGPHVGPSLVQPPPIPGSATVRPPALPLASRAVTPAPTVSRGPALQPAKSATAQANQELRYRPARHLMSKSERAFWGALYHAVKKRYRVFAKIRLADVVVPDVKGWKAERKWFYKIGRFHVDFVVCEPATTRPLVVIELDDRSHRSAKRQDRDRFKDAVLQSAGVPILRLRVQQAYDVAELAERIDRLIAANAR